MPTFDELVDPELLAGYTPEMGDLWRAVGPDMAEVRAKRTAQLAEAMKNLPQFSGTIEEKAIPGLNGAPDVPVRVYQQDDVLFPDAVMVWLHGGGYVLGSSDDPPVFRFTHLCQAVSVEYRMAPEHRCPAGVEDACAAIEWVAANAAELGIDPKKIIIGGPSGGGGLAAGAALLNRDRGGPELLYQFLIYPMIDDTHNTPSGHMDLPPYVWTREVSLRAWSMYVEEEGPSYYAAAARVPDVTGLPPTYIMTGELDLFRDECLNYARRLIEAAIPIDLAVFPGAPHGFELLAPHAGVSKRANTHMVEALKAVLGR